MGTLFSLSKPWTLAWLAESEWALLLFGFVLAVGLVGEYRIDHNPPAGLKKSSPKRKAAKKLFEFLVIIGVAGELFADGGIFEFSGHLQTITDLEVAQLGKEAADARLETVRLKQQMAQTSNSVANLDASQWRVFSLTAEVRLRFSRFESDGDLNFPSRLILSSDRFGSAKILLLCDRAIKTQVKSSAIYVLSFKNIQGQSKMWLEDSDVGYRD